MCSNVVFINKQITSSVTIKELQVAVKIVESQLGINLSKEYSQKIKLDEETCKANDIINGNTLEENASNFINHSARIGMDPQWLFKNIQISGYKYKIVGLLVDDNGLPLGDNPVLIRNNASNDLVATNISTALVCADRANL
tara:strand:+ start:274 stop:696 length:423 start_codon:yes stop_codon:yes gene_type:complete